MKIGVVSDTHDNLITIKKAVAAFREEGIELVLHAGDYVAPFAIPPWKEVGCPVVGVYGNNDGEKIGLLKRFEEIGELHPGPLDIVKGGCRIALMHEPFAIEELFAGGAFDLIVYGHLHKKDMRTNEKTIIINPGDCSGWLDGEPTVAVVDTVTREIKEKRL